MEAKDTVMSDVTPVKLLQNQRELEGLLREQAEISFKAGMKEEQRRMTILKEWGISDIELE